MQRFEGRRDRASEHAKGSANWIRLGLISTSAIAPLIARWNDLRVARRELLKHEAAEARLRGLRAGAVARADTLRARIRRSGTSSLTTFAPQQNADPEAPEATGQNIRLGLWLAGVGLGLIVAGSAAYLVARRRLAAPAEESLVEQPATGARGMRSDGWGGDLWVPRRLPRRRPI